MKKTSKNVDEALYEHYRTRMKTINDKYKTSFIYTVIVMAVVAVFSVFKVRIKIVSAFPAALDMSDSFVSNLLGGLLQIFTCLFIIFLAYLAWANFPKLNLVFLTLYTCIFVLSIIDFDWKSLMTAPIGIFLYSISSSALIEQHELSRQEGYPNFTVPIEQIMNDNNEYKAPGIPGLKSDYDDFFSGKTQSLINSEEE